MGTALEKANCFRPDAVLAKDTQRFVGVLKIVPAMAEV
jgi:hypothetical protein